MTPRARLLVGAATVLVAGAIAGLMWYRHALDLDRVNRDTADELQRQIVALDGERARLRTRLEGLVGATPGLSGMPQTPVTIGVPTALVQRLADHTIAQFADRVSLRLADVRVRRTGTVRRRIVLGDYDLIVTISRVTAALRPGALRLTFGGNRIGAALPLRLASGSGRAVVDFVWDGRAVAGAVCGDLVLSQTVTGLVTPRTYPMTGALVLEASSTGIVVRPQLPRLQVRVDVEPSPESWAALQKVLDDKRGLCGFVVDRVNILDAVKRVVERGFRVRIPTERVPTVALPVAFEPALVVRGAPLAVGIRIAALTVTDRTIWLGATLRLALGPPSAASSPATTSPPAAGPDLAARRPDVVARQPAPRLPPPRRPSQSVRAPAA